MKILIMTDNPNMPTGMGRVGREIALALSNAPGIEIIYVGWFRDIPNSRKWPFRLYPVPQDGYGQNHLDEIVLKERPDVVLTIGDPWMCDYLADHNRCRTRRLFQWVGYVAVDGEKRGGGVPNFWGNIISQMDRVIAYSEYGKNALLRSFPDLESTIDVIYHGVDTSIYKPISIEKRNEFRKKYGIADKFVFLTVARNSARKNWPELFYSWRTIVHEKVCPNAIFWPHTYFYDNCGLNLDAIIETLGLSDTQSIFFFEQVARGNGWPNAAVPESMINMLYNIADAFVLTCSEGFGLPIFEAFATKLPCILLNHSTPGEIGANGRALFVDTKANVMGKYLTDRPIPDSKTIVAQMKKMYDDPQLRKQIAELAYDYVQKYTWEEIGHQWRAYFHKFARPTQYPLILEEVT